MDERCQALKELYEKYNSFTPLLIQEEDLTDDEWEERMKRANAEASVIINDILDRMDQEGIYRG